jgi:hypothetical protein
MEAATTEFAAMELEKRIPLRADGDAELVGVLRLRECFAFAKHLLRSG